MKNRHLITLILGFLLASALDKGVLLGAFLAGAGFAFLLGWIF